MYNSLYSSFVAFHNYLIPYQAEKDAASKHRQTVVKKLEDSFGVQYTYETGSLNNGTSIHNFADLDILASIPTYGQRENSTNMLGAVRDALSDRFPFSSIGVRTPAVQCNFGSEDREVVEVVPAYYEKQVNNANVYKIPDFGGGWQLSAPRLHNQYVRDVNAKLDGKVKHLIRFVKAVKYYNNIPLSSFYLEMRVTKWCSTETTIAYGHDLKAILSYLHSLDLAAIQDPAGVVGYIYGYSTEAKKIDALSKLSTAAGRAQKAYDYQLAGDTVNALYWWNMVFAGNFIR